MNDLILLLPRSLEAYLASGGHAAIGTVGPAEVPVFAACVDGEGEGISWERGEPCSPRSQRNPPLPLPFIASGSVRLMQGEGVELEVVGPEDG
jgi:hypothetical protein